MATSADYSLGPNTFPRGWFIIAESSELATGPKAVRFFGQDMALYRGESGKPVLLDAYCAHMGTHLAASDSAMIVKNGQQIEGDSIRCPYHGWRYGPDGQVDNIPYHDGPCPKSAAIRSYPVIDNMGCVMMWYDPDGREPDFEPPYLPEWDAPNWVQWELDHLGELDLHPQEVLDNMADSRHLGPTHGAPCEYFENEFRDHLYIQRQGGPMQLYDTYLKTTTWYTGPGLLLSKQAFAGMLIYELIANTPVDDGRIKVWHGCIVQAEGDTVTDADRARQKEMQAGALEAFSADFNIWANKKPAIRVMQLKTDGPFRTGRKWYSQFFAAPDDQRAVHSEVNGKYYTEGLVPPAADCYEIEEGLFN